MIEVDTFKIAFDNNLIRGYHPDKYINSYRDRKKSITGEIENVLTSSRLTEKIRGLTYLDIKENETIIQGSSKILGLDSRQLLNKNNFPKALKIIAKKGGLDMDIEGVLHNAKTCMVDPAKNVYLRGTENVMDDYVNMLKMIGSPGYYRQEPYNNSGKKGGYGSKGIVFRKVLKTENRREKITFYPKGSEISSNDIEAYNYLCKIGAWEEVERMMRIEGRLSSHKKIRQRFGISDVKFWSVLNANINPVDSIFADLIKSSKLKTETKEKTLGGLILPNCKNIDMRGLTSKQMDDIMIAKMLVANFGSEKNIRFHYLASGLSQSVATKKINRLRPYIQQAHRDLMKANYGKCWTLEELKDFQELVKRA